MKRRDTLGAFVALAALPRFARAQAPTRVYRVGVLSIGTDPASPVVWVPFFDGMRALGYFEGKNVEYVRAYGSGRWDLLKPLVTELIDRRVDVIVLTGAREVHGLLQSTSAIPAFMTATIDPVGEGLVASLARPGGNVTGFTLAVPGLHQKFLELLTETVPSVKRIAAIASAPNPVPQVRDELFHAAKILGVSLTIAQFKERADIEPVLARLKKEGVGGLVAPLDGFTNRYRHELAHAAEQLRLPAIYSVREYVEAGGLMSYGPSWPDVRRRAADYVDRILKGARAADLPVQQPTRFELVLNLKAAKAIGLSFPSTIMVRAEAIIQ
jgi:putative ABC transport system substrate-binding protein